MNKTFSLLLIPSTGDRMRTNSITGKLLITLVAALTVGIILSLFFMAGYYIKSFQESRYLQASLEQKKLLEQAQSIAQNLEKLNAIMKDIQRYDRDYRLLANMPLLDSVILNVGVGGHRMPELDRYNALSEKTTELFLHLEQLTAKLSRQVDLEKNSFAAIERTLKRNTIHLNHKPSLIPTETLNISSTFGMRRHPVFKKRSFHGGIDLRGRYGSPIIAAANGVVKEITYNRRMGWCIKIDHGYGYKTLYGHLQKKILVKKGQKIKKGDRVASMGRTGITTGVHLHYEVHFLGKRQNPWNYFDPEISLNENIELKQTAGITFYNSFRGN